MAAKVGVLAVNQPSTDQATTFVKRSAADALVRRLIAERVSKFVIRLLPIKDFRPLKAERQHARKYKGPAVYEHHIEPKLHRVNRREIEELERWRVAIGFVDVLQLI